MAYIVNSYSGAPIATVQDGTINRTSTALTLIGRDYAGYGEFLNENFVYLLENFASNVAPEQARNGQLWYDTGIGTLKVWGFDQWKPISSSLAQSNEPASATSSLGDLWFKTNTNQLYVFNAGWKLIGPEIATSGDLTSGTVVDVIKDTNDIDHTVIKIYLSGQIITIISNDDAFIPKNSIDGFENINPGINLISSDDLPGAQVTANVENALKLDGLDSTQFLRSDENSNTPYQLSVGNLIVSESLNISKYLATTEVSISSLINSYNLNFYNNISGTQTKTLGINGTSGIVSAPIGITTNNISVGNVNILLDSITVSGSTVVTEDYVQTPTRNSQGNKTISTLPPSGGNDGDIWYQV